MIEWTREQLAVLEAEGDILVTASAGCGKTTVMLERVLRKLRGGASLSRMLISTFANSAAADMRAKLNAALYKELETDRSPHLRAQLEYLPQADISTLHTWCLKLIRKYFFVTGDDPAFELAGETEAAVWKNAAVAGAIEELAAGGEHTHFFDLYSTRGNAAKIARFVLSIMEFACSLRGGGSWLDTAADGYGSEAVAKFLNGHELNLLTKLDAALHEFRQAGESVGKQRRVAELIDNLRYVEASGDMTFLRATGVTEIKEYYDRAKEIVKTVNGFRDARAGVNNDEAREAAAVFARLTKRANELYAAVKQEKGKLDFNDLESKATQILQSNVGGEIRRSYDYIFIDEYQDISPVQEGIIRLLKGDNEMFFVGDIKQSIYAFRNCTPDAFVAKSRELPPENILPLSGNFRCKNGILVFCNSVFGRIMTESFGKVDYAADGKFAASSGADDGSVEVTVLPKKEADATPPRSFDTPYSVTESAAEESGFSQEAEAVASKIVGLLGGEFDDNGVIRPVGFDDIVVISRSRTGCVPSLVALLRKIGVPVSLSKDMCVTDSFHNRNFVSMLRIIDNSRDDISLLAVMRSYFGKFSDYELVELRRRRPRAKYFFECLSGAQKDSDALAVKVRAFTGMIDSYAAANAALTVSELAGKITADFDYFKFVLGERDGNGNSEALGSLLSIISSFSGDLSELLSYLDEAKPSAEAVAAGGSVRILTVHAAKGLEYNTVLLCNLNATFNTRDICDCMYDSDFGISLLSRSITLRRKLPSDVHLAVQIRKTLSVKEEEMRILYVAMTRAKHKLVLFMPELVPEKTPEDASRATGWLAESAAIFGVPYMPPETVEPVAAGTHVNPNTLESIINGATMPPIAEGGDVKQTVTDILAADFDNAEPKARVLLPEYEDDGGKDSKGKARETGIAYHKALELYDYAGGAEQLDGLLAVVENGGLLDRAKLERAVAVLTPLIVGKKIYREQPFLVAGENGVIIQGVIDLIITDGETFTIVDYKTGDLTPAKTERYIGQLNIYASAVCKVLGLKCEKFFILSIDNCDLMCYHKGD